MSAAVVDDVKDTLAISDIRENPDALRPVDKEGDGYIGVRNSIEAEGVLQPIIVRPAKDAPGKYVLVDGLHRYTACKDLGISEIPAIVRDIDDMKAYQTQIITNLQRVATKPAEYARQLKRMQLLNPLLTIPELAEKIGIAASWFLSVLRLTDLDPRIQALVDNGTITVVNALALSTLPKEEQADWLERASTMTGGDFKPLVDARVKEIRKAKAEGRDPNAPREFVAVAKLRKLPEILDFRNNEAAMREALGNITDPFAAFMAGINWSVRLDDASVNAAKAEDEKKEQARKQKSELAKAERLEKQAAEARVAADKIARGESVEE